MRNPVQSVAASLHKHFTLKQFFFWIGLLQKKGGWSIYSIDLENKIIYVSV